MYVYAQVLEAAAPTVFMVWLQTCVLLADVRTAVYISDYITIL